MSEYVVIIKGTIVAPGDYITAFDGSEWLFQRVTRGPEHNGTAKLAVEDTGPRPHTREFYHSVFPGLEVMTEEASGFLESDYLAALLQAPRHHNGR